uniref:Glutaredoxin-2, mitochondrial n=1 Tax=Heliothis virescens TaxID=7102 RepID=A0A2A4JX73_HELVI
MGSQSTKIVRTSKMASSADVQLFIKKAVTDNKVVVFSKSYCPYCTMAKEVFQKVKQPMTVIELDERDDGAVIQETLAQMTGFRTVPQVFINGNCVGGGTDVKALHSSGKLEPMLIG